MVRYRASCIGDGSRDSVSSMSALTCIRIRLRLRRPKWTLLADLLRGRGSDWKRCCRPPATSPTIRCPIGLHICTTSARVASVAARRSRQIGAGGHPGRVRQPRSGSPDRAAYFAFRGVLPHELDRYWRHRGPGSDAGVAHSPVTATSHMLALSSNRRSRPALPITANVPALCRTAATSAPSAPSSPDAASVTIARVQPNPSPTLR